MNEDEAQRMRDAIKRDQTSCRCGHLLAACADCRDWLIDHSPRIAASWRWWVVNCVFGPVTYPALTGAADAAEADDRASFGL